MEVPTADQITEGDRLRWRFPNGTSDSCEVKTISAVCEEGVSVYAEHMMRSNAEPIGVYVRHIRLDWLTHYNGRRLDQAEAVEGRHEEVEEVDLSSEAGAEQVRFLSGEEPEMAKKAELKTSTRKSMDEMSESHRQHIEKWEPHLDQLKGEHVWAAVMRVPGRGVTGPVYVAVKRGAKDYAIVDYDTETMPKITPKRVLADGFESSTVLMEAFKEYRQKAKDERNATKTAAKPKPKKAAKKPTRKTTPKKTTKPKAKATRKPKPKAKK